MSRYDENFFQYFYRLKKLMDAQSLNLSSAGGYIGMLPQNRISYDTIEDSIWVLPSGTTPTLIDNLNRIRYRLDNIETTSGISIEHNTIELADNITVLNFEGDIDLVNDGNNTVTVKVGVVSSGSDGTTVQSGVFNENLSNQIIGHTTTLFSVANQYLPNSLALYYNGIRQTNDSFIEASGHTGFTTLFTVLGGDTISVDYAVSQTISGVGGGTGDHHHLTGLTDGDDHPQYLTSGRANTLYPSYNYLNILLNSVINPSYFTAKGDIIVASGLSSPQTLHIGENGSFLVVDNTAELGLSYKKKYINQQTIFSVEGKYLSIDYIGTKALKFYVHDVGNYCSITEIFGALGTAPTVTPLQIDVLKNGVSLCSPNYLEFAPGAPTVTKTGGFSSISLVKDDYLQIAIIQGDANASDLTIHVRYKWEL